MNILIGCEESQAVCIAFRKLGLSAYSCDLEPCSGGYPEYHLQMDLYQAMKLKRWDMGIFFTPCTYSCNSGIRWMYNKNKTVNIERFQKCEQYAGMLRDALNSDIPHVSCENPIPHHFALNVIGRKYDQIIQPYQFGHGEQKSTCLWLKNLPLLRHTNLVDGREQKMWKMPPSDERSKLRSKTYPGIAQAMAKQYSEYYFANVNNDKFLNHGIAYVK